MCPCLCIMSPCLYFESKSTAWVYDRRSKCCCFCMVKFSVLTRKGDIKKKKIAPQRDKKMATHRNIGKKTGIFQFATQIKKCVKPAKFSWDTSVCPWRLETLVYVCSMRPSDHGAYPKPWRMVSVVYYIVVEMLLLQLDFNLAHFWVWEACEALLKNYIENMFKLQSCLNSAAPLYTEGNWGTEETEGKW